MDEDQATHNLLNASIAGHMNRTCFPADTKSVRVSFGNTANGSTGSPRRSAVRK